MKEMLHDEFLERLAELEPPRGAGLTSLADWLPGEAAAHAAACEDCARAAEALLLIASDERSLFDEPSEEYWRGFSERLAARLSTIERPAGRSASAGSSTRLLRIAALLLIVAALAAFGLRDADDAPRMVRQENLEDAEPLEDLDELLAAWSVESSASETSVASEDSLAALLVEETLPGLVRSPADALLEELSLELDDAQSAELARRLRAEISS